MMDKLKHYCTVQDGPDKGCINIVVVEGFHLSVGQTCDFCGEELANANEILAAIYEELTS